MKTPMQIRLAIAATGMPRQKIADLADVAITSVRRYESGDNITRSTANKIDNVLSQFVTFVDAGDIVETPTVAVINPDSGTEPQE